MREVLKAVSNTRKLCFGLKQKGFIPSGPWAGEREAFRGAYRGFITSVLVFTVYETSWLSNGLSIKSEPMRLAEKAEARIVKY